MLKEAERIKELEFVVKLCCVLSQNRINFKKPSKTILFPRVLVVFERFFKLYSILAEKQRNLTTNSSSLILSTSFAT